MALIVFVSLRHGLAATGGDASTASIDALCPFGGLETLWRYITTGQFISKAHPSNLIIGLGLLISVLLAGSAFCGWICPFGTLQERVHGFSRWLQRRVPSLGRAMRSIRKRLNPRAARGAYAGPALGQRIGVSTPTPASTGSRKRAA